MAPSRSGIGGDVRLHGLAVWRLELDFL